MLKKSLALFGALVLSLVTGCASWTRAPVVKIGYVNPTTGALSGNGEGYDWVIDQIYEYIRENPVLVHGRKADVQIIVYDSRSNPELCMQLAERLVLDDKVDLLIAAQTPETVIPVTSVAEKYKVPCVAIQAPVDPLAHARDSYEWTYHAFWTIDKIYECYRGLWTKAGFPPNSGAKVGTLFANDADGNAWHAIFVRRAKEDGYVVVDPGQYLVGNRDFSLIAKIFAREKVNILTGTNIPPDFLSALAAFKAEHVVFDCITMGKCCLMQSDVSAFGEAAIGLMSEIWWDTEADYVSDLTGTSSVALNEAYAKENFGKKMPQPAGYAYAALELAVHTIKTAASRDKKKLLEALAHLDVNTIIGPVCYNQQMGGLHYSETVVAGGQWKLENGELVLRVVDNSVYPSVKVTADYESGNVTKRAW